ncbi:MAG: hypothetical protein HQL32_11470 [Planctomycetes bacterium]|nr:hypothetical protein [Planctomycetota bacterium]
MIINNAYFLKRLHCLFNFFIPFYLFVQIGSGYEMLPDLYVDEKDNQSSKSQLDFKQQTQKSLDSAIIKSLESTLNLPKQLSNQTTMPLLKQLTNQAALPISEQALKDAGLDMNPGLNIEPSLSSEGTQLKGPTLPIKAITDAPTPLRLADPKASKTLADLELSLNDFVGLSEIEKLRLQSLIQEMRSKYDDSYLTWKSIKGYQHKNWFKMRELFLADKLGLEEDREQLAEDLYDRYFRKSFNIKKIEFCTGVQGFGNYTPLSSKDLAANQKVMVYVELEGLSQDLKHSDFYSSTCRASFNIVDEKSSLTVYSQIIEQDFQYKSRSKLNDYFIWFLWKAQINRGQYKFVLKIEDLGSSESQEKEKSFWLK